MCTFANQVRLVSRLPPRPTSSEHVKNKDFSVLIPPPTSTYFHILFFAVIQLFTNFLNQTQSQSQWKCVSLIFFDKPLTLSLCSPCWLVSSFCLALHCLRLMSRHSKKCLWGHFCLCLGWLTAFNNAGVVIRKHNCERHQRKRMSGRNTNTSKCIREEIQFLGWRARTKLFSQSYILAVATKWKLCEEDSLSCRHTKKSEMDNEINNPPGRKFHSKVVAILITSDSEMHLWRLFNECHSELLGYCRHVNWVARCDHQTWYLPSQNRSFWLGCCLRTKTRNLGDLGHRRAKSVVAGGSMTGITE